MTVARRLTTTLFVPVRNEIVGLQAIMPQIDPSWVDEIIFVDGSSTDGTYEWLVANGYRVLRQRSKGICGAYWECLEVATGDVIIPFSPDNNSIPEVIPQLVAKMREGYDMVIASRYVGGATSEDDDPVTAFGNRMFTLAAKLLFGSTSTDSLVMYRAFKRDLPARLEMDERTLPVFEMQMVIRCAKAGCKVADIPGSEPKRLGGVRKMSPIYNGASIVYVILKELFVWRPRPGRGA